MSKTLASRTVFKIAKTYGAAVNMTAITNDAEAVATLDAGHGVIVGEYLEITSGWGRLNERIVRAKAVNVNDVTLEGLDTTSTDRYPAGSGTGSIRRITAWEQITQVKNVSSSGGEQQFTDATDLEADTETKVPTIRSSRSMALDVFDDPALAWYATVGAASDAVTPVGLMVAPPNGSKLVANAYWSLQREPDIQKNEIITSRIDLTFAAPSMRYAT